MRIFVLTFLIACAFYGKAEDREIPLTPTQKEDFQDSPYRTPPIVPAVEYEGDMFTVTTPFVVKCVPFAICDEDGAAGIAPYIAR